MHSTQQQSTSIRVFLVNTEYLQVNIMVQAIQRKWLCIIVLSCRPLNI